MAKWSSIAKNTLALSVPNLFSPIVSFVLVLLISRYLGVGGLGQYTLILSYVAIFGTLASLGLGSLLTREVTRSPEQIHDYLMNSFAFGAISSAVAILFLNVITAAMGYEPDVIKAAVIFSFSLLPSTGIYYLDAVFRAAERSEYIALTYIPEQLLRVAVCVGLLVAGYGIVALFIAILSTRVFGLCLMFGFYLRAIGRPYWSFKPSIWRTLAKEAPTFTSIVIFSIMHYSLDQIILSKMTSIESVGLYSAAGRLVDVCRTLPLAFSAALLPFLTREYSGGMDKLQALCTGSLRYMFIATIPVAVGTTILADDIIALIYGAKFAAAADLLRVQIFALIPFSMALILASALIATDNQKVDLKINIASVAVNIALNLVLIPFLAEMGAVLAGLGSILFFNQLQNAFIKKNLFSIPFFGIGFKALAASAGMALATYLLRDWNITANVLVSAIIYVGLLFCLRAFSTEEINLLKSIIKRKGGWSNP